MQLNCNEFHWDSEYALMFIIIIIVFKPQSVRVKPTVIILLLYYFKLCYHYAIAIRIRNGLSCISVLSYRRLVIAKMTRKDVNEFSKAFFWIRKH